MALNPNSLAWYYSPQDRQVSSSSVLCYTTIILYLSAMSSGYLRNFQNNFGIFCEFWILLDIDRAWHVAGCCKAYFRLCLFVFDKFDCHLKNLSLKLKLTNGRTTLCRPCTLPLRAIIMNLMSVGLMADWGFPQLDLQGYRLLSSFHFSLFQCRLARLTNVASVPCLWMFCVLLVRLSCLYYTLFIGVVKG